MRSLDQVTTMVRTIMRADDVATADRAAVAALARSTIKAWQADADAGLVDAFTDVEATEAAVVANICDLGPLDALFAENTRVEEVFIEGDRVTYLRDGKLFGLANPSSAEQSEQAIQRLLADTNASLDRDNPGVDGVQVLGGRARLSAFVPPASPHLSVAMRFYVARFLELSEMVDNDSLSPPAATLLTLAARVPLSVLIDGPTGSGKTTLLAAMLHNVAATDSVRVLEESFEVQFTPPHGGRLQCVPARRNGTGGLTMRDLVKRSLRLRPDIVVVGEVRGEEAWDLARASRVGAGFMATIHAPSAEAALEALVLCSLQAAPNLTDSLIRRTFSASIDLVVHCEREGLRVARERSSGDLRSGPRPGADRVARRQVTEIRAMGKPLSFDAFTSEPILVRKGGIGSAMEWTGVSLPDELTARLERHLPDGVTMRHVLDGSWTMGDG